MLFNPEGSKDYRFIEAFTAFSDLLDVYEFADYFRISIKFQCLDDAGCYFIIVTISLS